MASLKPMNSLLGDGLNSGFCAPGTQEESGVMSICASSTRSSCCYGPVRQSKVKDYSVPYNDISGVSRPVSHATPSFFTPRQSK